MKMNEQSTQCMGHNESVTERKVQSIKGLHREFGKILQ